MDDNDLRENRERPSQNSARVEKEYAVSTDELSRAVLKAVSQLSNWSVEEGDPEGDPGDEIHAVRTTKVLRFKDDISISISETDTGAKLVADSESRVGKSDLGQNPRNIDELLETIEEVMRGG